MADLADLVSLIEEKNVVLFLESFWITIIREWNAIDVLRMDKFLLLVRSYLAASFRYLVARKWGKGIMRRFVDLLRENPLKLFHLPRRFLVFGLTWLTALARKTKKCLMASVITS